MIENLNEKQRQAVLHKEGPLLILAGAGSGKTKTVTSRISHLMTNYGVSPEKILAMTFTNKAAGEMKLRIGKFNTGLNIGSPEVGTFHSVCVRLLRQELRFTPFSMDFVIYDDSDQLYLIKNILNKMNLDEKSCNPKLVQYLINHAKCDAQEPGDSEILSFVTDNLMKRCFQEVYQEYQNNLFKNNAIDFGEIIVMAYRLLRDYPELRKKYQNRFQYVHVDEYQDTNRAQYLFLSTLVSSLHGGHGNICVVGDEDQSIYKWRGADIRNILNFEKDFPGACVVKLEENYRSTQNILSVAHHVIQNNLGRKEKKLWTRNEIGASVVRIQSSDERAEAESVVSEMRKIKIEKQKDYGDFSIFYRTHAQSRPFEDVLRREKIPYQIFGGLKFYDRKEIKDIISYFKVILNSEDSVNLKRILNVPARGLGKTTLEKLEKIQEETDCSLWKALLQFPDHNKKISSFIQLIQALQQESAQLSMTELYQRILDKTGYLVELKKEQTEESFARVDNLEEFYAVLQDFEAANPLDKSRWLALFLEQSSLAPDTELRSQKGEDLQDLRKKSVQLMTLHSSKGLEFPIVFVVGMEEGLFPSIKLWEEPSSEEIEEERRLCYVGMTRAREHLYLTHVLVRRIWGQVSYQKPSRFFSEIPKELLKYHSASVLPSITSFSSVPSVDEDEVVLVGRQIVHPDYGQGRVIYSEGKGVDQKVTIQFSGQQKKKFLLRYLSHFF